MNSSADMWPDVPDPGEAKFRVPGFARARATSSPTLFAGTEGCTSRMFGTVTSRLTGAKSFTGSYGSLGNRLTLMACVPMWPIMSV